MPESTAPKPTETWPILLETLHRERAQIAAGGGPKAIERQHEKQRLTVRERIAGLVDPGSELLELGRFAAWGMYQEWGGAPAASVVCGIGRVSGRTCMVIANDATVKAGAFFPMTVKKVLRAQRIAMINRLPLVYLVDSSGVFLPLQDEIFPDEDDFGRIFRNNAVLSAMGVPQIAAIMGNCVAGGGYLPVLCDKLVMTDGSGLYLAGPALVKSSIGQEVTHEDLGGAHMHAAISGTIDFREPDDPSCLARLRSLVGLFPDDSRAAMFGRQTPAEPARAADDLYELYPLNPQQRYEVRDLLACLVDAGSFQEYKAEYGRTLVCGYARIGGFPVGIVASQHHPEKTDKGELHFGGVIYHESADKAARFVMDCNQTWLPLVFLQDVYGFMVGRDSEQGGIIRAGAKLVNAIANSRVPKLTVILGGSYGAGNYALCGKAFDPRFIFAWPTARYAVMGAGQAAATLLEINIAAQKRAGRSVDAAELEAMRAQVVSSYEAQTDVRHAAARGWVDEIIEPAHTRLILIEALQVATRHGEPEPFRTGVFQV
ncbi:MAG: acyl-CoA carboxylase subunit beta [Planctomycetaceae bacterium]|nr:acyl-CoA carboxylase subunit beta [Planctomycetaceae bacterium]